MALILEFHKGQFWGHCYFGYRAYIIDLSAVSDIAFPIMFADDTHNLYKVNILMKWN